MMLLILAVVAWISVLFASGGMWMAVVLVVLSGLFVAVADHARRNPLAGAVFTGPMAGDLAAGQAPAVARPDDGSPDLQWVMLGVCAMAAFSAGVAFSRLKPSRGPVRACVAGGPARRRSPGARARHPIWLLVKQELALQHLALVVATVYSSGWCLSLFDEADGWFRDGRVWRVTVLYSGQLAVLIGALASARANGNSARLEWQALLPIA